MLLTQIGRGPRLAVLFALSFTFVILLQQSSYAPLPQWQLSSERLHQASQELLHKSSPTESQPGATAPSDQDGNDAVKHSGLPCKSLPGGEDVLVVMRTGATEIKDKLPAQLYTNFECFRHHIIFSDYEEDFLGFQVHDVLKDMPQDIKATNEDFKHYLHIQHVGRTGLDPQELSGKVSEESGPVGKNDNAGWRLDKWKFLPMMNQTLNLHPHFKWYVFLEPDTYFVWSNFLQWIAQLDASKPLYYGSEVQIGEDLFAHGGSAFVISKPALEKGVAMYNSKVDEWHAWTAGHWAGDCVLGRVLHDAGVDLSWGWPMFQGGEPAFDGRWLEAKRSKTMWCAPALSYHHMVPSQILDYWHFEQKWIREHPPKGDERSTWWHKDNSRLLHHGDTFKSYVLPNITEERHDWDSKPETQHDDTVGISMEDCKAICQKIPTCLHYAVGPFGCSTGVELKMGRAAEKTSSGWMLDRVAVWQKELDKCSGKDGWSTT
ncbi:hypothetical protein CLAFUW4_01730 [Fulvia fulva]|uniref:Glycosyltransferase family 31 protein n=1 Tax=Passalora fulva TaxID=5499 RepID=A0A9Q8L586_PASFU|nr:uncharacterized protein CLAFUR5_01726 [Fulvia fulva]KAK4635016.1 hypothetical protein CLAFUR4_01728 [Fulvia fulva]KAK4636567.1 hypothetical protein CLAFUR0_01729 [Fulvia fulva]UJO10974.1 hypothetical protein CLAFUR5_01726 [Fulvia fulva]WPV09733.1 hypothetical protein CLAFUW4_01730 [Fulvia fulva]WPV23299.1 hypothetical protein CLAFUW7_01732 [Fulvia fulva]